MPQIILENVTKRFGKFIAVDKLNMVIDDRAFITLLGPSGCGKTTTLRMIAGLETPTEGRILIDGKVMYSSEEGINVPPDKRDVGFLFQNYALWPHMTVNQNIAFGLENLKWNKADIKKRTEELLAMLKIAEFGDRYPSELSGGQQQRVAIARTLATKPKVLFMDEPLSNLDAKLRTEMRTELKRLHKDTDSTFVYVTHDQLEAMTLATKICLMKQGYLQQYAPPLTVYNKPSNIFVADFVGSPSINFVKGTDFMDVCPEAQFTGGGAALSAEKLTLGIRPECIQLTQKDGIDAAVYSTLPSGMETILRLKLTHEKGEQTLTSVVFGDIDFEADTKVHVAFNMDKILLFDTESGNLIPDGKLKI